MTALKEIDNLTWFDLINKLKSILRQSNPFTQSEIDAITNSNNSTGTNTFATLQDIGIGLSDKITYKSKATYALMIADEIPTVPTMYSITNDENKSYSRSTYLWKPDGNREWIATTPDN